MENDVVVKNYMSQLGKKSAEKRKNDKRFGKEYYSKLGKKSVESKRRKKKESQSSTTILNKILKRSD